MSRFFLHSRADADAALIEDPEGSEFPNLETARDEAIAGLRQLAADELRQNLPVSNRQIDIYDAGGRFLATVSAQGAVPPLLP